MRSATVGERIHKRRLEMGLTVDEVAAALGKNRATVYRYENSAISNLPSGVLEPLARVLKTTPEALMGWKEDDNSTFKPLDIVPVRNFYPIPIMGSVRAGWNGLALEEHLGVDYADVGTPDDYFYLRVKGDSMAPAINDGDLALVHCQPTAESGDIVVAVIDDDCGTIKKYIRRNNTVILQPFNPAYEAQIFTGSDLERLIIAGKVIETKKKWA